VEAPSGGDDAVQEGVLDSGKSGPIVVHLGAIGAFQDPAWLRVAELPALANKQHSVQATFSQAIAD